MALNETQRQNLSKLDVMDGTGIFSKNTKVDSVDQPTVIISLGGLGGKTLDQLKNQINRRVNKTNNAIRLLAIDSADADLERLIQYGNLTKNEVLSLYDSTISAMGKNRAVIPEFIQEWLNENHYPDLSGEGCGGVRQNGRFILSVPSVYNKVRNRLKNVILDAKTAAPNGRINVIFIAGISGGTGSGTFIDMAYLTQDVLQTDIGLQNRESYNMSAYIYMPDVQFGNGANQGALKTNGYAALKELDYFYNLDKVDGVYEWPFAEGKIKNSKSNIYDFCTLISANAAGGSVGKNAEDKCINVTVESLMSIITNAELTDDNGKPQQILTSFLDNYETNIDQWMITGNGSQVKLFPRSANYKYNVIGYGTARIPVDAIMSYIALKMYDNVLDEFHNMNNLTPEFISKILVGSGLGDMGALINAVKEQSGCIYRPAELPKGGDIHGVKGTYVDWRDRAINHYLSFKNSQQFAKAIDSVTNIIVNNLEKSLEIAFGEHGPYFVVKAITASFASDNVDGILRKIDALIRMMSDEYAARYEKCNTMNTLIAVLDQKARELPAMLGTVKQQDRDNFINGARITIERFTIEMEVLSRMQDRLIEVRNHLVDSNNKTFDVYTDVLDYIKSILTKNSDLVVNSSRNKNANGGETYSLDVVNLDAAHENGRKLKSCLDSFLSQGFLNQFKDAFITLLRDPKNRPAFTTTSNDFDATGLLQNMFDKLLGEFYNQAVERFLIAYYSPSKDMNNIQKLDEVMKNDVEKKEALRVAVNAICKELQSSAKPLCQIIGGSIEQFAEPQKYMCCPSILFDLFNEAAPAYFPGRIKICKRENAFSIDVVTSHIGIPLTKIHGINDADVAYDQSITNNIKGLHLNESKISDFKKLPAPFIREAWDWVGEHNSDVERKNMEDVAVLVKKLTDCGLLAADAEGKNVYVKNYFNGDISDAAMASFKDQIKYTVSLATVNSDFINAFLTSSGIELKQLPVTINEKGLTSSMDTVSIIIRKNINLYRKLVPFMEKYEELNTLVDERKDIIRKEFEFNKNMVAFTNLIKTGLVKYNPNIRCWNYFDGTMEKPLYNFAMSGPFEVAYNLYFVFAEYVLRVDPRLKDALNNLVTARINSQQINFVMPEEINNDINKLFAPGTPGTINYVLDNVLNKDKVNQPSAMFAEQFGIALPVHEDNFEVLMKFYNAFRANFN